MGCFETKYVLYFKRQRFHTVFHTNLGNWKNPDRQKSHLSPPTPSLQGQSPLLMSHTLLEEPSGSQSHSVQPSAVAWNPGTQSSQRCPVADGRHLHWEVMGLQMEPLRLVPNSEQLHTPQPAILAAVSTVNPLLHVSQILPSTFILHIHCPLSSRHETSLLTVPSVLQPHSTQLADRS